MGVVRSDIDEIVDESREAAELDVLGLQDFRPGPEALVATHDAGRFNERERRRLVPVEEVHAQDAAANV